MTQSEQILTPPSCFCCCGWFTRTIFHYKWKTVKWSDLDRRFYYRAETNRKVCSYATGIEPESLRFVGTHPYQSAATQTCIFSRSLKHLTQVFDRISARNIFADFSQKTGRFSDFFENFIDQFGRLVEAASGCRRTTRKHDLGHVVIVVKAKLKGIWWARLELGRHVDPQVSKWTI